MRVAPIALCFLVAACTGPGAGMTMAQEEANDQARLAMIQLQGRVDTDIADARSNYVSCMMITAQQIAEDQFFVRDASLAVHDADHACTPDLDLALSTIDPAGLVPSDTEQRIRDAGAAAALPFAEQALRGLPPPP